MAIFSGSAKGPLEALLRLAALAGILGLVVMGFWKNSERQIEGLNARFGLADETKGLSEAEREHVQAFITAMRAGYGLEARVQVRAGRVEPPKADGKTLFVGLDLEGRSAVVLLPPLVARALGPDFARRLEGEHFPFHFAPGKNWQKGLVLALDLIQARLAALGAPTDAPGTNNDPTSPKDMP